MNLMNEEIDKALASLDTYFFVGENYRLTKTDYEAYKGRWSNLLPREVLAELDRADKYYSEDPGRLKNVHFQFLAWLDKANKKGRLY